jgi:hypothetical protein
LRILGKKCTWRDSRQICIFLGKLENTLSTCPKVGFLQKIQCISTLFLDRYTSFCLSNACPSCPPLPPLPRRYRQKEGRHCCRPPSVQTSGPIQALRPLSRLFLMYWSVLSILRTCADLRESYQMVFRPVSCRSRSSTICSRRCFLSQSLAF